MNPDHDPGFDAWLGKPGLYRVDKLAQKAGAPEVEVGSQWLYDFARALWEEALDHFKDIDANKQEDRDTEIREAYSAVLKTMAAAFEAANPKSKSGCAWIREQVRSLTARGRLDLDASARIGEYEIKWPD